MPRLDRCDLPSCRRRAVTEWWWTDAGTKPDRLDWCPVHTDAYADALVTRGWMLLEDTRVEQLA